MVQGSGLNSGSLTLGLVTPRVPCFLCTFSFILDNPVCALARLRISPREAEPGTQPLGVLVPRADTPRQGSGACSVLLLTHPGCPLLGLPHPWGSEPPRHCPSWPGKCGRGAPSGGHRWCRCLPGLGATLIWLPKAALEGPKGSCDSQPPLPLPR